MEMKLSSSGGSSTITAEYYLDHAEASGESALSDSYIDYDEEEVKDTNVVGAFKTTNSLAFLGIIGCILGLIGTALMIFGYVSSKGTAVFVLLAVILTLFAPLYLMLALPGSFDDDAEEGMVSPEDAGKNFFGSEKQEMLGGSVEYTWGGSSGWFAAIIAEIICLITLILIVKSKPEAEPKYKEPQIPFESTQRTMTGSYHRQQVYSPPYQEKVYPQAPPVPSTYPQGEEIQCPGCHSVFILAETRRPAYLRCPYCGLEGVMD
ncbi:MAG: hypothetical protein JSV09_04830 [Thermoplasmata archaeon]|nr:MAG: hypothetical protein JSV09_04830 [Thermoplasmata archaeon]